MHARVPAVFPTVVGPLFLSNWLGPYVDSTLFKPWWQCPFKLYRHFTFTAEVSSFNEETSISRSASDWQSSPLLSEPMASKRLLKLYEKLSSADFDLICSLITSYNTVPPKRNGQTHVAFEFVRNNLEERYHCELNGAKKVFGLTMDEVDSLLCEWDIMKEELGIAVSPNKDNLPLPQTLKSQKYRNLGRTTTLSSSWAI